MSSCISCLGLHHVSCTISPYNNHLFNNVYLTYSCLPTLTNPMSFVIQNVFRIVQLCWGREVTQSILEPASQDRYVFICQFFSLCQWATFPVTPPLLVALQPARNIGWLAVCFGRIRDVAYSRTGCQMCLHLDEIQLPYIFSTVSLSLITSIKSW